MTSFIQKLWAFCPLVFPEFLMFSLESYGKKETALILKYIEKLPQNFARIQYLVGSLDRSHKNFNFFLILATFSIVFYCSSGVCSV